MGLKDILLKLEKSGFLIFHQVTDTDFIDEIENIIPDLFSSDVYGIVYYTYDDFIASLQSGFLKLNCMDLENENFVVSYIKDIFNKENIDHKYINKNTFFVSLNGDDFNFMNKKTFLNSRGNKLLKNLVH